MMNKIATIKMANRLIQSCDIKDYHFKQAQKLMDEMSKNAGLWDYLKNPFINTIMSLLNPYLGNYRVKQAVQLLLEALKESV